MRIKRPKRLFVVILILLISVTVVFSLRKPKSSDETIKEISPTLGSIRIIVSTTGTVLPKNRLEIKPPVNGRIERILVEEGQKVKTGDILAWMSSTERAALIDAARGKGEKTLQYWEETYKPIPLPSPIDAEVIVATTQPGQVITTTDAVVVLSDHLIVRAQVDETDIGKISEGMHAQVTLDAYPDTKIRSLVEHIYHESKTVNNVTIYEVDLIPEEVPHFFRSGMNATVDFIVQEKKDILIIPLDSVYKEAGESFVLTRKNGSKEPSKVPVKLGISDDKNAEVLSGITQKDRIIAKSKKYVFPKASTGSNPFMPFRRRQ